MNVPPGAGSPRGAQSLSKVQAQAQVFCLLAEMSGTLSLIERSFVVFKLCEWHMGTMKTLLSCDPPFSRVRRRLLTPCMQPRRIRGPIYRHRAPSV